METTYKISVIEANSNFKKALRSTGKAVRFLLASDVLDAKQAKFLKEMLKDDAKYKDFDAKIRRTKNGEIVIFYVLQALWREIKPTDTKAVRITRKAVK